MKIKIQQFLAANHSWAIVGWNLAREFKKLNHNIDLFPTDKGDCLPEDLLPNVVSQIDNNYDMQISYTAMINFANYLSYGTKSRYAMWAYEFNKGLPKGFAKHYNFIDKLLAPSNFCKEVFLNGGIPENKLVVVPHGINLEEFKNEEKYPLQTKRKYKILINLGQIHLRKNLKGIFTAFGKAFNKNDDVCLVAKVSIKKELKHPFEINFYDEFESFKRNFPNHAPVEIVSNFVTDMATIYNSCDIVFGMSNCEGWWLPGTESFAKNKLTIAPNHGGQLDFMNENNSLLIGGKIVRAPKQMMYWESSPYAEMFEPSVDDAVEKLKYAVNNYDELIEKFKPGMQEMVKKFTWENAAKQILDLTK